jgi:hypothetical protein
VTARLIMPLCVLLCRCLGSDDPIVQPGPYHHKNPSKKYRASFSRPDIPRPQTLQSNTRLSIHVKKPPPLQEKKVPAIAISHPCFT